MRFSGSMRSSLVVCEKEAKARRAAATVFSASAALPSAIVPIDCSVQGSMTSHVFDTTKRPPLQYKTCGRVSLVALILGLSSLPNESRGSPAADHLYLHRGYGGSHMFNGDRVGVLTEGETDHGATL
ncbi:UNVERIFIED_ORG: hypothetical protein GGD47_000152 [Rhizobium etli]